MSFRMIAIEDAIIFIDAFGESAFLNGNEFQVIFDLQALLVDEQTGEVELKEPQATALTTDVDAVAIKPGDTITIDDIAYKIKATPKPDGFGLTLLRLNKIG